MSLPSYCLGNGMGMFDCDVVLRLRVKLVGTSLSIHNRVNGSSYRWGVHDAGGNRMGIGNGQVEIQDTRYKIQGYFILTMHNLKKINTYTVTEKERLIIISKASQKPINRTEQNRTEIRSQLSRDQDPLSPRVEPSTPDSPQPARFRERGTG